MLKILKYRDLLYIAILFIWFVYPRQNSVKKETKPNRQEIKKLEKVVLDLKEKTKTDSLTTLNYLKKIDSLVLSRQVVIYKIKKQNEKIDSIKRGANLTDSALYRYFTEFETAN